MPPDAGITKLFVVAALFAVGGLRGAEPPAQDAPPINFRPGNAYGPAERKYQGVPTLERAPNGRLWAAWYAGPVQEDRYNYVVAATSERAFQVAPAVDDVLTYASTRPPDRSRAA